MELLGINQATPLRNWVEREEIDAGNRPGVTSTENTELLKRGMEIAELKRANEKGWLASVALPTAP